MKKILSILICVLLGVTSTIFAQGTVTVSAHALGEGISQATNATTYGGGTVQVWTAKCRAYGKVGGPQWESFGTNGPGNTSSHSSKEYEALSSYTGNNIGILYKMQAVPATGYYFEGWATTNSLSASILNKLVDFPETSTTYKNQIYELKYYAIFKKQTVHRDYAKVVAIYLNEEGVPVFTGDITNPASIIFTQGGGFVNIGAEATDRKEVEYGNYNTLVYRDESEHPWDYTYYATPAAGYALAGWYDEATLIKQMKENAGKLLLDQPAGVTCSKSFTSNYKGDNAADIPVAPTMYAVFRPSLTYYHTGVSVNIAGYEDERAEKGWVYADKGELGTVAAVESAGKWEKSIHDETVYPSVDQTEYQYTYYAKVSDSDKYAFKGWTRTPYGEVTYTDNPFTCPPFTMTDDNTTEENAYPTATYYAVIESFFYKCPPVAVADNSRGGGLVYVSLAPASIDDCTKEEISAGEDLQQVAATNNAHSYTVYYYAKKTDGAEFVGWSTTPDGLNILPNSIGKAEYSVAYESQNKSKSAPHVAPPLYAVFKHDFDIRQQDRMIVYDEEDGNKSINDAKVLIDFQKGNTLTAALTGDDASYFTLSNHSGSKSGSSITFDATQGLIEMVVAYQGDLTQAVGKKAEITLSATYGDYIEPVKRNVTITVEEAPMITFLPTDGKGSYTIKMTNGSGVNYTMSEATKENIKVQITHESMSNLEMNLTSDKSGDDYRFFGWQMIDGTATAYISYDDLVNYQFTKSVKVRPEFIHNSAAIYSIIGDETNTPYHDFALVMNDAKDLAASMGVSQTVVLNDSWKEEVIKSGVLPQGNYTIPSGVNLLIPGDKNRTYRTDLTRDAGDFIYQSDLKSSEYIRWIVEEGTNITVQEHANILVYSRIVTYANDDNGRPYQYGHIELKENCKFNFLSGSNLYVYGYITGPLTSEITMNSGTTVKEVFQVKDWRGGTATSLIVANAGLAEWLGGKKRTFLIGQYYVQNIEVPLIIKRGASEILEAGIADLADMDVNFVVSNTDAGLFRMGEGTWIKKYYDPYTDRLCFIGSKDEGATGEMHLNYVSIDAGIANVSSADYVLPIPNNFDIKIQGNLTGVVLNDVAFMPGSTLTVDKGSILRVNKRLFAYDDVYKTIGGQGYYGAGNKVLAPLTYRPGEPGKEFKYKRTEADLVDAKFIIDGELICDGGEIYTTNATSQTTNHANITSNGGGKVTFGSLSGYDSEVYQIYQDGTSPIWKSVSVAPARLRHGDNTYETNPQTGTYTYVNNKWTLNASTTPNPTIPAEVDYIPRFTVSEVSEASTYVGKSTTITVSASANNTNIPTEDWANATKMTWKYELIGTDGNQFTLSGDGGAGTITFAPTSEGRKIVTLRITATYTKNVNSANTAVKYTYSKDVQLIGNASYLAANTLAFADLSRLYHGQTDVRLFQVDSKNNTQPINITITPNSNVEPKYRGSATFNGETETATITPTKVGSIVIKATQDADLTQNIAATTITKIITINNREVWNWDVLYFGTVNQDPITMLDNSTGWTLVEKTDTSNIINFEGTYPNYTATIEDQIAGEYGVEFTFKQGDVTKDFKSVVIPNPQYLRVDVNNDTVFRAVTLSANNNVAFNPSAKAVQFTSTVTSISQWKMTFIGIPDKLYFTPVGQNTWQIEESSNNVNWTTSVPWKFLEQNVPFEMSLLPSTRYVRISYGAGPSATGRLNDFYITELADVKADVQKLYMPVESDGASGYLPVTKEVVLTYANVGQLSITTSNTTDFKLRIAGSSNEPSEAFNLPATTEVNPFAIAGIEVISNATTEQLAYIYVYQGSKLLLQIPIQTYFFPQDLPIKLATDKPDGGDRYYFVTTHTHNAEWDGTDDVRTIILNNAVSDAAPYLTFAFDGSPTYISFDYTADAKGRWEIEESTDGEDWNPTTPVAGDVMADGKLHRTVNAASKFIRVIYESPYAEKVQLTDLVIVGNASVIVNPKKLELNYNEPKDLTVTAINLTGMTLTTSGKFYIAKNATDSYTQSLSLTSTDYAILDGNTMGDIPIDVKWTGDQMVEYGTLVITNPNDNNAELATVQLVGIKNSLTGGELNMYTGVAKGYTLNGSFGGSTRRLVDISAAFSPTSTPLFNYVVIYGETSTNDGNLTITQPSKTAGSNAKTPCYIYQSNGTEYVLKEWVENANSKDKVWPDAVTIPTGDAVSMYITGFCPYASTGYTKDQEGVWYFRANGGQSINLYLEDCYIYSRAKTIDGHTFADRYDGQSFVESYVRGSGAVLVFMCDQKKDVNNNPMQVTIHTLGNNLLKSNYGCFLQSIAGRAFQASSPVQIRIKDDTYYKYTTPTHLNFTDEWPASKNSKTVDGSGNAVRTNGFLSLQKQVNNAPSIDMGSPNTVVNFNGGQVELQNAQIVSHNYKSSLAVCPRSGKFAEFRLAYGMGTDDVGGTVYFNDGTTTVLPMWVSPDYFESYLCDKDEHGNLITNAEGEYLTTCLRTPTQTFVKGGSHCMMRACKDPSSQGGAPKDAPEGKNLGLYKYPSAPWSETVEAETVNHKGGWSANGTNGLVTPDAGNVPDGYNVNSVTPNNNATTDESDDFLNFWFDPDFEPAAQPEIDKTISFWKTCMTEISAEYASKQLSVGGTATVEFVDEEQTEVIKNLLYCKIDDKISSVIQEDDFMAPVKNPAPEGDGFIPIHPSSVGTNTENFIDNWEETYQVEDKVYYITTATADVWNAFTAPFNVANIYIMETYPEQLLEEMEWKTKPLKTRDEILTIQAEQNAYFAAFFGVTIALKQDKNFNRIYNEYIEWAKIQDQSLSNLWNGTDTYTLRGKRKLVPYDGTNWSTADFYLNENTGSWEILGDDDGNFTTTWEIPDASDGILMHQGKTYGMMFPFCTGCVKYDGEGNLKERDFYDYWTGKFLIFESIDGPHKIHGLGQVWNSFDNLDISGTPSENVATILGNSSFGLMEDVTSNNSKIILEFTPGLANSTFYVNENGFNVQPTVSYMFADIIPPTQGQVLKAISMNGKATYSSNNPSGSTTGGNVPTVGGGNDLFITAINGGINIAVAAPQQVRVITSTGAAIFSGYVTTAVDVSLPTNGVYMVAGETEVHKVFY